MNQLFRKIENFTFPELHDKNISIPGLISVRMNLTDLKFHNLSIDSSQKLMNLVGKDEFILTIKDFKGLIRANYMYITDPPLLADIGSIHFEAYNTTFLLNGTTDFEDGLIYFDLNNVSLWLEPFVLHFDGISDTSDVISRLLTFGGNVIGDRLQSMSHYEPAIVKLNNLVNTIVGMIPDEFDIPGTNLYLEGGIQDEFTIKKNAYIELPLDISL